MSEQHNALLASAAKVLTDEADRIAAEEASKGVRARAVAAMQVALRNKKRNARRRTWAGRMAVAAAVALALFGGARLVSSLRQPNAAASNADVTATARPLVGETKTWRNGQQIPFGGKLASGDRIVTAPAAHAEIALSTGTSVVVGPASDLTFHGEQRTQTFALGTGAVNARVAKLLQGDRFLVRTLDTEVEVRGTVFEVSVVKPDASCGAGTPTRVHVTEGVVVVRNHGVEARVAAGESWPTGCSTTAAIAPAQAKPTEPVIEAIVETPKPLAKATVTAPKVEKIEPVAPVASAVAPAPAVNDTLAEKNDLFASALAAKHAGQLHTALARFESYLAKYPGGELVESATAQRMNILSKIDRPRAVIAARDYLARFPNGFARAEAEALAKTP